LSVTRSGFVTSDPAELDLMAQLAGTELRERWAGWDREPFTGESSAHVSAWTRNVAASCISELRSAGKSVYASSSRFPGVSVRIAEQAWVLVNARRLLEEPVESGARAEGDHVRLAWRPPARFHDGGQDAMTASRTKPGHSGAGGGAPCRSAF
jgi:hypothetical protein